MFVRFFRNCIGNLNLAGQQINATRGIRIVCACAIGLIILWPIGHRLYRLLQPLDTRAIYEAGLSSLASDDLGKAQLAVELLSASGTVPAYLQVLQAAIDLRFGRLQQAATGLIPALEDPATSAVAHTLTGEAFYKNRQFAAAIKVLLRAVEIDDSLVVAHRWLAAAYYDIGTTGPAIEELQRVSELAPDDPRPHRLMGLIYKDMESYDEAIVEYREALERSSDFADRPAVLLEFAACLVEVGLFPELDEVLAQCPVNATVLGYSAQALAARGEPGQAMQKLDEALALEPENLPALLLKGQLLLEQSSLDEAVLVVQQAVQHHPLDNGAHYQLSQLYARQGEADLAQKHAAESTRLRELRTHFTDLHAQASGDSSNAELRYQLGMTAKQLGLTELAITWFSAALALDANHVQAAAELQLLTQPHEL